MSRNKRIIIFTLIFLLIFVAYLISRTMLSSNDYGDITTTAVVTKYNNNLANCAWIPNWASIDGYDSLVKNADNLSCISPVLYEVNADGSLRDISPTNLYKIVAFAKSKNIKIYPTIAMFDHEIFSQVVQNELNYQRHIDQIIQIVNDPDYDGIDLDYESTKLIDKDKYNSMIIELSNAIHARNKKLIVTVLAKWGDDVEYPSLKETRKVQDWRFIADYADWIRIMAYDYTFIRSKLPGPIAPIAWIESIIQYAKTKIPDEKIVLAAHLYSYQWSNTSDTKIEQATMLFDFAYDYTNNSYDENIQVASYDYETVKKILSENQGQILDFQGEKIFVYQKSNAQTGKYENRVLVYIDQLGVLARQKLAAQNNLSGLCFWRLGKEDNLLMEE